MVRISNVPTIRSFVLRGVFDENQIHDLWVLIIWPQHRQNFCKMFLRFWQSINLALVKRNISFAKNKCDIWICPLNTIGWIMLSLIASSNRMERRSKHKIKRYGDKGSPWRTPLLGITSGSVHPFHWKEHRVEEIMFIISVINVGGTWKNLSDSSINGHFRRS